MISTSRDLAINAKQEKCPSQKCAHRRRYRDWYRLGEVDEHSKERSHSTFLGASSCGSLSTNLVLGTRWNGRYAGRSNIRVGIIHHELPTRGLQAMAEEKGGGQVTRVFEQPPDSTSFYSDYAQIIGTGHEVVMQFYETIPGPPSLPSGAITTVRTRLRVTVSVSPAHAANIGKLLIQRVGEASPASRPSSGGQSERIS